MNPKVSVLMSVYNAWPYLPLAVESVLTQSYNNFEFLIIDDGSTDEGANYLDGIDDKRVKVIHQQNKGLGKALNKWMHSCQGDYIMRVDADDQCDPSRIEKQVEYLDIHKNVIMVGTQIRFFSKDNILPSISRIPTSHDAIVDGMKKGWHTMCHASMMFRKTLLEHIEGYEISGVGEDWAFILDAAEYGKLGNLSESLYHVRIHPSSNAWNNPVLVIAGLTYATRRAEKRDKGIVYSYEMFKQEWEQQSRISRFIVWMRGVSQVLHRKAVLNKLNGNQYSAFWLLSAAALLDLNRTFGAVRKMLTHRN